MNGQIAPLTLNAQNAANEPMIKKKNCLINIEYVFPLSCNEVTVEEDSVRYLYLRKIETNAGGEQTASVETAEFAHTANDL